MSSEAELTHSAPTPGSHPHAPYSPPGSPGSSVMPGDSPDSTPSHRRPTNENCANDPAPVDEPGSGDEASSGEGHSSFGSEGPATDVVASRVRANSSPATMELDHSFDAADQTMMVPSIELSVAPTPNSHPISYPTAPATLPTPSWTAFAPPGETSCASTPSGMAFAASPGLPFSEPSRMAADPNFFTRDSPSFFSDEPSGTLRAARQTLPPGLSASTFAPPLCMPPVRATTHANTDLGSTSWDPHRQAFFSFPLNPPCKSGVNRSTSSVASPTKSHLSASNPNSASTSSGSFSLSPALPFADLNLGLSSNRSHSFDSTTSNTSSRSNSLGSAPCPSQTSWFAFLFELDPELTPHAEVLSLPELGVTPASFFRQRRELRTLFLSMLAGRMQAWPRMCLQDALERNGERVWAAMQAQEGKGGAGWAAGAREAGSDGLMLTF